MFVCFNSNRIQNEDTSPKQHIRKKSIGNSEDRVNIYTDEKFSHSIKIYEESLRILDKTLLTQNYVAGDSISIADIVLAECFTYESLLSFSSFSRRANIRRWHALVKKTLVHWSAINDTFDKFAQFWNGINTEMITLDHNIEQTILLEDSAASIYRRILGVGASSPQQRR